MIDLPECKIVLVVGNSRSGTTMMSRILGRHPKIFAFNELQFFEHHVDPNEFQSGHLLSREEVEALLSRLLVAQRDGVFAEYDVSKYIGEAGKIIEQLGLPVDAAGVFKTFCLYESSNYGKPIACEQTPKNIYYAEEILAALPMVRVINMVRDPRDVLLSQKRRWRRRLLGGGNVPIFRETLRSWLNYHPITMGKLWHSAVVKADALSSHPRFLNVRFETLLSAPEKEIGKVCSFLGIAYYADMLNVPRVGSSNVMDDKAAIGIDSSQQGNWQRGGLSRKEVAICQRMAGKIMQRYGYQQEDVDLSLFALFSSGVTFVFKMGLALLFNLGRTKNLYQSIRRRFT